MSARSLLKIRPASPIRPCERVYIDKSIDKKESHEFSLSCVAMPPRLLQERYECICVSRMN